jgi:hypothetical protein
MRGLILSCLALAALAPARAQKRSDPVPFPEQFEIGRRTFFDFGPPFDFYEVFIVHAKSEGSSVERILLTPPGDACYAPAKMELSSALLSDSPARLLGKTNPCSIPEKEVHRELKRCRHCLQFSGANVTMRVPCGKNSRLIRSEILDRDMFDPAPRTPEHTSWTMQLLQRLDQSLEPGVADKPMFSMPEEEQSNQNKLNPSIQQELDSGAYDELFPHAQQKASDLSRDAHVERPIPTIRLLSIVPAGPLQPVTPEYPPLAKMAHVEGPVSFKVEVTAEGRATTPVFEKGNPLLFEAVNRAVSNWEFAKEVAGQEIHATIEFALNCTRQPK